MLETKVYIKSRKRFSEEDIEKIKIFLRDTFGKSIEIEEINFQQRSAVSNKISKDSFELIKDDYYASAFDFFELNEKILVKIGKIQKEELSHFNIKDDSALIDKLMDIYGSSQNILEEWLKLEYSTNHFYLIEHDEEMCDYHVRVWKFK